MAIKSDEFFKWVWKINGLLLLGLCVAGVVTVFVANMRMSSFSERNDDRTRKVILVGDNDILAENLTLGAFEPVRGTPLLYATLSAQTDGKGLGSTYGRNDARNILFFDAATKKVRWLFKGNAQSIPSVTLIATPASNGCELSPSRECDKPVTTSAILFETEALSAGDRSMRHPRRLLLASPAGTDFVTVADSIDALLGKHKTASGMLLAFYSRAGAVRVAEIDVVTRKVTSDDLLAER